MRPVQRLNTPEMTLLWTDEASKQRGDLYFLKLWISFAKNIEHALFFSLWGEVKTAKPRRTEENKNECHNKSTVCTDGACTGWSSDRRSSGLNSRSTEQGAWPTGAWRWGHWQDDITMETWTLLVSVCGLGLHDLKKKRSLTSFCSAVVVKLLHILVPHTIGQIWLQ